MAPTQPAVSLPAGQQPKKKSHAQALKSQHVNWQGYLKKYETLKKRLRKQVAKGKAGIEKAACEYAIWFYKNFDTHYQLNNTKLWESYEQPVHIDYKKIMEYNPQPVSCKVNKQTWLVRVPSCVGENPTNRKFGI